MYKIISKSILLFFMLSGVLVLVTAYIQQSFNPKDWSEHAHPIFGSLCFINAIVAIIFSVLEKEITGIAPKLFVLFTFCFLLSCTGKTKVIETRDSYVVELMAEREGCKLYKVHNAPPKIGTLVYWTICKDKQVAVSN